MVNTDCLAEVQALEQRRLDALQKGDVATIAELMSKDLVHIHATGAVENREQYLDGLKKLPRTSRRESLNIVLCSDQAAVLTGRIVNSLRRSENGPVEESRLVTTLVVRREPVGWRYVSFHACRA